MCLVYTSYSSVMIILVYNDFNAASASLTSLIQSFLLMSANLSLIARTTFASEDLLQIENTLTDIIYLHVNIMNSNAGSSTIQWRSYIRFVLAQAVYLLFMVSSYYIWGHKAILQYILQVIPEYLYLTVFLIEWEILNALYESLKYLNGNTSKCFIENHTFLESPKIISIVRNLDDVHAKLNTILLLVEKHNDIVFYFNRHFGWNILFSTMIAVQYFLGFVSELFSTQSSHLHEEIFRYIAQIYTMVKNG